MHIAVRLKAIQCHHCGRADAKAKADKSKLSDAATHAFHAWRCATCTEAAAQASKTVAMCGAFEHGALQVRLDQFISLIQQRVALGGQLRRHERGVDGARDADGSRHHEHELE